MDRGGYVVWHIRSSMVQHINGIEMASKASPGAMLQPIDGQMFPAGKSYTGIAAVCCDKRRGYHYILKWRWLPWLPAPDGEHRAKGGENPGSDFITTRRKAWPHQCHPVPPLLHLPDLRACSKSRPKPQTPTPTPVSPQDAFAAVVRRSTGYPMKTGRNAECGDFFPSLNS